jgi:hypothetical protein
MKPEKFDAIVALVGGAVSQIADGTINYLDGQTPPSESVIDTKLDELVAEYDALEYSRNRRDAYPDWGTQLEKIADDGIDAWKADMLEPVKAKFPKP